MVHGGYFPILGKATLLLVFVRLVHLVFLAGMLVAWRPLLPLFFAAGVWLCGSGSGSSSFLLVMSAVAQACVQAHLGAGQWKCLGIQLRARLLTLGLVLLFLWTRGGGSSLCTAGGWFFLHRFHFEAFAVPHVHLESLPRWEYFLQALPTPKPCIVMCADDMVEVGQVVTA